MARTIRVLPDGSTITAGTKCFRDYFDILSYYQDPDETLTVQIDWTGFLEGETISDSGWEATGITISNETISGGLVTATISGVPSLNYGTATNTITTSGGRIAKKLVRFYDPAYAPPP